MNLFSRIFQRGLSCEQVALVLQQYLDDELGPDEVPKVLKHLETCKDCGLEAKLYTQIKGSLITHQQAPDESSLQRIRDLASELAAAGPYEGEPV